MTMRTFHLLRIKRASCFLQGARLALQLPFSFPLIGALPMYFDPLPIPLFTV